MTTKQRDDLQVNIPALRKLDAMLIVSVESFHSFQIAFILVKL